MKYKNIFLLLYIIYIYIFFINNEKKKFLMNENKKYIVSHT